MNRHVLGFIVHRWDFVTCFMFQHMKIVHLITARHVWSTNFSTIIGLITSNQRYNQCKSLDITDLMYVCISLVHFQSMHLYFVFVLQLLN